VVVLLLLPDQVVHVHLSNDVQHVAYPVPNASSGAISGGEVEVPGAPPGPQARHAWAGAHRALGHFLRLALGRVMCTAPHSVIH
jgi:hypothetical protein